METNQVEKFTLTVPDGDYVNVSCFLNGEIVQYVRCDSWEQAFEYCQHWADNKPFKYPEYNIITYVK
jgi:hypothetical protein